MDITRSENSEAIIWTAAGTAAVAGALNPIPLAGDGVILITAWVTMLASLASVYGMEFDKRAFKIAAFQAFKSVVAYAIGTLTFIYLLKFTGAGSAFAALLNALLNFGFTAAVGFMYKDAWEKGEEPTKEEMIAMLKGVVKYVKSGLTKQKRKEMTAMYQEELRKGRSKKDAVLKVVKQFFENYFD
jgi:uncharacterized protein (DUF697 family)